MIIIGVGGGSGSGKSHLVDQLHQRIADKCLKLPLDNYYRPYRDRPFFERMQINFDDPGTLDWELLKQHMERLQEGKKIEMPEYSYERSTRVGYRTVEPKQVVLFEGIYALYDTELNAKMDLKVFLDPDDDVRAVRRVKRDVTERGRDVEFAVRQYLEKTKGMHETAVAPTKEHADIVLDTHDTDRFIDLVEDLVTKKVGSRSRDLQEFLVENI